MPNVGRLRSFCPGDFLDQQLLASKSRENGRIIKGMQFVSPFTYLINRRVFQMLVFLLGSYQMYSSIRELVLLQDYGMEQFREMRVAQNRSDSNLSVRITFLLKGCSTVSLNLSLSGFEVVRFLPTLRTDGFEATLFDRFSKTEMKFILEGSNDGWKSHFDVCSSDIRWTSNGVRFLPNSARTTSLSLSYRPPWPWYLSVVLLNIIWTGWCLCVCYCGVFSLPELGRALSIAMLGFMSLALAVSAVGFLALGLEREAFAPFYQCIVYMTISAVLALAESFFFDAWAIMSAVSLIFAVVNDCLVYGDPANLLAEPPVRSAGLLLWSTLCIVLRRRFYRSAIEGIVADQAGSDQRWAELVASCADTLSRLDSTCKTMAELCQPRHAQQLDRKHARRSSHRLSASVVLSRVFHLDADSEVVSGFHPVHGTWDEASPVTSLDQLYSRALGLGPVLYARCVEWAGTSRGVVDCGGWAVSPGQGPALGSLSTHPLPGEAEWWAKWPCIKHPDRAIEKAVVCYGGDVSRLLDICRARILFTTPADLLGCIKEIQGPSSDVQVVRIKNYLREDYDSSHTAGYRVRS